MPIWSTNNVVRTPLLLLGAAETAILFSSVYFAGLVLFGDLALSEELTGSLAPRAATITVVILVSLMSMGPKEDLEIKLKS